MWYLSGVIRKAGILFYIVFDSERLRSVALSLYENKTDECSALTQFALYMNYQVTISRILSQSSRHPNIKRDNGFLEPFSLL